MATTVPPNTFTGVDASFVLITAFIVFTMQSGFGLLESGMVSRRSQANVMVKNMIDVALGGITYWFVGYGFSFGHNSKGSRRMSGESDFMTDVDIHSKNAKTYIMYFFQLSFAITATTVVSGAVAERIKLIGYMIFAVINTGLIYVFPCHWIWSPDGWLYGKAKDHAGSSVVHMSGGAAAIAACIILKPRRGRFVTDDKYFAMANPTNVVLGTFFLWWGWIGFNCGSQLAISGDNWWVVGRVAVVTMNGAMGGGASAVLINIILYRWRKEKHILDIGQFTAAILGGLVSITAPSNVIRPWEGLVIGFIGGAICLSVIKLVQLLKIDDPVGVIGMHWSSGFWGMIATGLFANVPDEDLSGVFRKGNGKLLGWNILAGLVVTLWSGGCATIVFLAIKYTIGIRLSEEDEIKGSDEVEHNICKQYADEAYNHALGIPVKVPRRDFPVQGNVGSVNDVQGNVGSVNDVQGNVGSVNDALEVV